MTLKDRRGLTPHTPHHEPGIPVKSEQDVLMQAKKKQHAQHAELKKVDDSNQLSFSDAISNIQHLSNKSNTGSSSTVDSNSTTSEDNTEQQKNESVSEQLGIKDSEYIIPVEPFEIPHFIAIILSIAIPSVMFIGSFVADGWKALVNFRMLLLIPIIIIFYLAVKWTKDLGRVDVKDIERAYPDIVIVDGTDESDDPKRPSTLNIRTSDDSTASFTMVTRQDWESNMPFRRRQGVLVVKNGKAAVMVEDTSIDQGQNQ